MSALHRMVMGEHRHLRVRAGDTVMLSSRTIPGNEVTIGRIINQVYRMGAKVVHARLSEIHVSGHAAREEQAHMIRLTRPRYFIPVHGEWRHLVNHADIAESCGVPRDHILLMEDGNRARLSRDAAEFLDPVTAGRTFVDGHMVHDAGQVILRDRQTLREGGILIVVVGVDRHSGRLIMGPELMNRGFVDEDNAPLLEELRGVARAAFDSLEPESRSDAETVRTRIRNRVRKHIERTLGRRPMVMPMILEM